MFYLLMRADKEIEILSPENIVGAIEFQVSSKKIFFEIMKLKVCLMSSKDIVAISKVDMST